MRKLISIIILSYCIILLFPALVNAQGNKDTPHAVYNTDDIVQVLNHSIKGVQGLANSILYYMISIAIIIFGFKLALGGVQDSWAEGTKLLIIICGVQALIIYWPNILNLLQDIALSIGSTVGGENPSQARYYFNSPSEIVWKGVEITDPIFREMSGWDFLNGSAILMGLTGLTIVLVYTYVALSVYVVQIEFYLVGIITIAFIPFAIIKQTSFMFERAIGGIINLSIRILVMFALIGIGQAFLVGSLAKDYQLWDLFFVIFRVSILAYLVAHTPGLAATIIGGGGALSGGNALGFAAGAAITAAKVGTPMMKGFDKVAGVAGDAIQGAVSGAEKGGSKSGSGGQERSWAQMAGGSLMGAIKGGVSGAAGSIRDGAQRMVEKSPLLMGNKYLAQNTPQARMEISAQQVSAAASVMTETGKQILSTGQTVTEAAGKTVQAADQTVKSGGQVIKAADQTSKTSAQFIKAVEGSTQAMNQLGQEIDKMDKSKSPLLDNPEKNKPDPDKNSKA